MQHKKQFERPPRRVALFVTCMVDMIYPQVGRAAVQLLEEQGVEVVFPEDQTCCGQPAFNSGYHDEAVPLARHFVDVFHPLIASGQAEAIVLPSGSCATMTSHFHLELLENDPAYLKRSEELAAVTFELTEFLVDVLEARLPEARLPGKVAYHACCHLLRELHIDEQPRSLLAESGLDMVDMTGSDECCGFGGLFAVKNEPISVAMGNAKLTSIEACGADHVVMCDVSCMTHLQGLLQRQDRRCRAMHIAEALASRHPQANGELNTATPAKAPDTGDRPRRWQDVGTD